MTISVVIPTLNEAAYLPATLKSLQSVLERGLVHEIIVVDGGSSDETVSIARAAEDVTVLEAPRGRANQMNAGAERATGRYLLFLHADTRLEPGGLYELHETMNDPSVLGGAFSFAIDAPGLGYRILERGVGWRARWFGLPYGDQALFVRRCVFNKMGQFTDLPAMEDADFVLRLRREGRLAVLRSRAFTSDRAWRAAGLGYTLFNVLCLLLFQLGIKPRTLARFAFARRGHLLEDASPEHALAER